LKKEAPTKTPNRGGGEKTDGFPARLKKKKGIEFGKTKKKLRAQEKKNPGNFRKIDTLYREDAERVLPKNHLTDKVGKKRENCSGPCKEEKNRNRGWDEGAFPPFPPDLRKSPRNEHLGPKEKGLYR